MKTLLEELREWCQQNCFNVEGQDGTKHIVLDQWELDTKIVLLIEKDNEIRSQWDGNQTVFCP